jgi:hypothetical protein
LICPRLSEAMWSLEARLSEAMWSLQAVDLPKA